MCFMAGSQSDFRQEVLGPQAASTKTGKTGLQDVLTGRAESMSRAVSDTVCDV